MLLLFLFVLVAALNAQNPAPPPLPVDPRGIRFGLDQGVPDGAIVTFFFYHKGKNEHWNDNPESVGINFYDQPTIEIGNYEAYDITAHLQIDRVKTNPVWSGAKKHGQWLTKGEARIWQAMDEISNKMETNRPPSNGYWRVDVIKHDEYQMSVFFQGFWSSVRQFPLSLNNLRSVYIISPHVAYTHAEMRLQLPNHNIAPFSAARFVQTLGRTEDSKIISFPNWPINKHIEITVVLLATAKRSYEQFDVPRLFFNPADGSATIFKMHHIYFGLDPWAYPHQLWIESKNPAEANTETPCKNSGESNGDLQHIYLQRISQNEIGVQVFYKPSGASGLSCVHAMTSVHADALDKPFDIVSHQGALILHLEHSIPIYN